MLGVENLAWRKTTYPYSISNCTTSGRSTPWDAKELKWPQLWKWWLWLAGKFINPWNQKTWLRSEYDLFWRLMVRFLPKWAPISDVQSLILGPNPWLAILALQLTHVTISKYLSWSVPLKRCPKLYLLLFCFVRKNCGLECIKYSHCVLFGPDFCYPHRTILHSDMYWTTAVWTTQPFLNKKSTCQVRWRGEWAFPPSIVIVVTYYRWIIVPLWVFSTWWMF